MFPPNTKILIADDLKTIRSLMLEILKKAGYSNFIEASDGKEAFAALVESLNSTQKVGLIISDWNMPNETGLDLLENKMAHAELNDIPFLMVTIESERDYVLHAVSAGVDDFVVKPFSEKTLLTKLGSIWNRRMA